MYRLFKCFLQLLFVLAISQAVAQNKPSWFGEDDPHNRLFALANLVQANKNNRQQLDSLYSSLKKSGTAADKIRFNYWLTIVKLKDKYGLTINREFGVYDKYLKQAEEADDRYFMFYLYQCKAQTYRVCNEFSLALENYLYALEECQNDPQKQYYKSSYFFHEMGVQFFEFKDYQKALECGLICHKTNYFDNPNPEEKWLQKANTNLLGEAYRKLGNYDSAKYWHSQCLNYSNGTFTNDTIWRGIATNSFAGILYDQQLYNDALTYYLKSMNYLQHLGIYLIDHNIKTFADVADIYMRKQQWDSAAIMLNKAIPYLTKKEFNSSLLQYYKARFQLSKAMQLPSATVFNYLDSVNKYQAIVGKELDEKYKIKTEANIAFRKKVQDNLLTEAKFKFTRLLLVALITLGFFVAVFIYYYQQKKGQMLVLQQQKLQLEKERAEESLQYAKQQLSDFAKNLQDKNRLIEQFSGELESLRLQSGEKELEKLQAIQKLKESVILTDADWLNYKLLFDKAYPGFADSLKDQIPSLTSGELRYLMFQKLKLDNKEMAAILGISNEAVRNLKYRVKNKLGATNILDIIINETE